MHIVHSQVNLLVPQKGQELPERTMRRADRLLPAEGPPESPHQVFGGAFSGEKSQIAPPLLEQIGGFAITRRRTYGNKARHLLTL